MSDGQALANTAGNPPSEMLEEMKESFTQMQTKMQDVYQKLATHKLVGHSQDKTVKISMTATYAFEDIEFGPEAMQGGIKEFRWRLREAWKDLCDQIQQTTQVETMEMLKAMPIPPGLRNMATADA